ncbi:MAG: secretin N-terminal domain-containing protein [Planctomycetota bacterium]
MQRGKRMALRVLSLGLVCGWVGDLDSHQTAIAQAPQLPGPAYETQAPAYGTQPQAYGTPETGEAMGLPGEAMRLPGETMGLPGEAVGLPGVPAGLPGAPARGSKILRKLPVPADQANSLATKLSLQFRGVSGVTITPDASRGELIVLAPAAAYPQIVEEANRLSSIQRPTQRVRLSLRHASVGGFEQMLAGMSDKPLPVTARGGGDVVLFNMTPAGLPATTVEVDRARRHIVVDAPSDQVPAWRQLIAAIDAPSQDDRVVAVVPVRRATPAPIQRAIRLLSREAETRADSLRSKLKTRPAANKTRPVATEKKARRIRVRTATYMQDEAAAQNDPQAGNPDDADAPQDGGDVGPAEAAAGLFGDVKIDYIEDLGQVIITGSSKDVERVRGIIAEIERQSKLTKPEVEVVLLKHVDSNALADLISQLYDDILSARQGQVSVTGLDSPNALLLIGRKEAIANLLEIIEKLDQPSDVGSRLRVYRLQNASVTDVVETIRSFFTAKPGEDEENRPALGTRVRIEADYRTNSVIVNASPRDLIEVSRLINELDASDIPSKSEIQVFPLRNASAEDLAPVIQTAIAGEAETDNANLTTPSSTLSIQRVDAQSGALVQSGVLSGAVVTADIGSNSLVIRAPSQSVPLIKELIRQLDRAPGLESVVKVFTIETGDAVQLTQTLQDLFGADAATTGTQIGAGNLAGLPDATASADSTLVPLRFATDQRSNSIIASGSDSDLEVVESILLRLDTAGFAERITEVIWLRHQPSLSIADALQNYISQRQQGLNTIQQFQQGGLSVFDLPDRDVIVVAEPVTNSLLISVAPRLYEDVRRLVDQLDRRPPMVMIKVLIAEVALGDTFEIGGELGLQDSLLFDRSIGTTAIGGDGQNGGFNFNASNTANNTIFGRENLAGSGLSTFGVGTSNAALGYGGFVLSAASESISLLLRTLQNANRLQILSRPQIMVIDNTEAFVQVGSLVARVTDVINNGVAGTQVATEDIEVGLILRVTPRVGSDGLIVITVDATRSQRDSTSGTPIPTGDGGTVIIDDILRTTAQSVVAAYSGQTVVYGGLIQKNRNNFSRRVPFLADIPLLGHLFRYDQEIETRDELLIVMTPMLVTGAEDLEYVKQVESARMSWCLADVVEMHGDEGLSGGYGLWGPAIGPTIYPDAQPTVDGFPAGGGYPAAGGYPATTNMEVISDIPVGQAVPGQSILSAPTPPEGAAPGWANPQQSNVPSNYGPGGYGPGNYGPGSYIPGAVPAPPMQTPGIPASGMTPVDVTPVQNIVPPAALPPAASGPAPNYNPSGYRMNRSGVPARPISFGSGLLDSDS